MNSSCFQGHAWAATRVGSAARLGGAVSSVGLFPLLLACAALLPPRPAYDVHTAPPPSAVERYCAWFGDAAGDTLYFGQSAFWSTSRAAGTSPDSRADLEDEGPLLVGRFDLRDERLLEPLDLGHSGALAGLWDVLAHPNGRVYFTSYFEDAGWVEPATGEVRFLAELGPGTNELALGPDGRLFVSRYPTPEDRGGLVVLDEEGALLAEYALPAPRGYLAGPKSLAVDPVRGDVWIAMDLLPDESEPDDAPIRHDAYVLDANGALLRTIERPQVQFPAFGSDGTGYRAEVERNELALRVTAPDTDPLDDDSGVRILLDPTFPEAFDFAQEVRPLPGGGAIVTRWSGLVHVVDAAGAVRTLRLPVLEPRGFYYSAVLRDGRICATYCGDVSVVCADAPAAPRGSLRTSGARD